MKAPDLRALRHDAGLTQRQLARLVGVRQGHVALFESGHRTPRLAISRKIAEALKVDAPTLMLALSASKAERKSRPERVRCTPCGRLVDPMSHYAAICGEILPDPEFCGPCGRPLTEAAKERAPRAGYIAFVADRERRIDSGVNVDEALA